MVDNARITTRVEYSPNANYSDPLFDVVVKDELDPTEGQLMTVEAVTAGGADINLQNYTTSLTAVVHNTDLANYVTIDWLDLGTGGSDPIESARILPGRTMVLPGVDPATNITLVGNTASCLCRVALIQNA